MGSETTAAAAGKVGQLRRDPFAMLPFCGYHMGDYFAHWLKIGATHDASKLPRLYYVNWFRQNDKGQFIWPGYGENSRVLKWVFERVDGTAKAEDTPIGRLPARGELDMNGLDVTAANLEKLLNVDVAGWLAEVPLIREHFAKFGSHLPQGLKEEVDKLEQRLKSARPGAKDRVIPRDAPARVEKLLAHDEVLVQLGQALQEQIWLFG